MGKWSNGRAYTNVNFSFNLYEVIQALQKVNGVHIDDDWSKAKVEFDGESINIAMPVELDVRTYYDPGCMYHSNGDPGDPPEWDMEMSFDEAGLENAFMDALLPRKVELDDTEDWEIEPEDDEDDSAYDRWAGK